MKVLIVKTSSMGDIIHTLPALTDAASIVNNIEFHWVVEESFSEVPQWHPAVTKVIPVSLRRWRKNIFNSHTWKEWKTFKQTVSQTSYEIIIDAQGLLKSAYLSRYAQGKIYGYNWRSIREPIASFFYHKQFSISKKLHAIERIRQLFANTLNYPIPDHKGDYGLLKSAFVNVFDIVTAQKIIAIDKQKPFLVFLHGTTRHNKHWPEAYWKILAKIATASGYTICLPWGSTLEHNRALRIAKAANTKKVIVLPKLELKQLASIIALAAGVVSVDTGLGHMTAALSTPAVSLYGSTNPNLVGTYGNKQLHLTIEQSQLENPDNLDCIKTLDPIQFAPMTPDYVWQKLLDIMSGK